MLNKKNIIKEKFINKYVQFSDIPKKKIANNSKEKKIFKIATQNNYEIKPLETQEIKYNPSYKNFEVLENNIIDEEYDINKIEYNNIFNENKEIDKISNSNLINTKIANSLNISLKNGNELDLYNENNKEFSYDIYIDFGSENLKEKIEFQTQRTIEFEIFHSYESFKRTKFVENLEIIQQESYSIKPYHSSNNLGLKSPNKKTLDKFIIDFSYHSSEYLKQAKLLGNDEKMSANFNVANSPYRDCFSENKKINYNKNLEKSPYKYENDELKSPNKKNLKNLKIANKNIINNPIYVNINNKNNNNRINVEFPKLKSPAKDSNKINETNNISKKQKSQLNSPLRDINNNHKKYNNIQEVSLSDKSKKILNLSELIPSKNYTLESKYNDFSLKNRLISTNNLINFSLFKGKTNYYENETSKNLNALSKFYLEFENLDKIMHNIINIIQNFVVKNIRKSFDDEINSRNHVEIQTNVLKIISDFQSLEKKNKIYHHIANNDSENLEIILKKQSENIKLWKNTLVEELLMFIDHKIENEDNYKSSSSFSSDNEEEKTKKLINTFKSEKGTNTIIKLSSDSEQSCKEMQNLNIKIKNKKSKILNDSFSNESDKEKHSEKKKFALKKRKRSKLVCLKKDIKEGNCDVQNKLQSLGKEKVSRKHKKLNKNQIVKKKFTMLKKFKKDEIPKILEKNNKENFSNENKQFFEDEKSSNKFSIICYKNGEIKYIGEVKDNKYHGKGILFYPSGKIHYKGFFKKNKYDGYGVYYYPDGKISSFGEFIKDYSTGYGILLNSKSQLIYIGNFKKDLYCGYGILYQNNNITFEGFFENSKLNGFSTVFYANGNVYYQGYYEKGLREKTGIYYFDNGYYYVGNFENNLFEDYGVYFYNNKKIWFYGKVSKGKADGFGVEFYQNGKFKYIGEFKNDVLNGIGIKFDDDESIESVGQYKNGKDFLVDYNPNFSHEDVYSYVKINYRLDFKSKQSEIKKKIEKFIYLNKFA